MLIGNQLLQDIVGLRKDLENWLSPPDPFINFNTADHARHEGTAVWFTQSDVFKNWKESSSLLWIHGKRTSSVIFARSLLLTGLYVHSGLWKICSHVRYSLILINPNG
jgi:hypothetical protein